MVQKQKKQKEMLITEKRYNWTFTYKINHHKQYMQPLPDYRRGSIVATASEGQCGTLEMHHFHDKTLSIKIFRRIFYYVPNQVNETKEQF